jgi:hypothetical protein
MMSDYEPRPRDEHWQKLIAAHAAYSELVRAQATIEPGRELLAITDVAIKACEAAGRFANIEGIRLMGGGLVACWARRFP